jgi:hypothetical protein
VQNLLSLDGFWTYLISGTPRGGLLCVKDDLLVGGDNIAFFNGLLTEQEGCISGTVLATRFNESAQLDSLWGNSPRQYVMQFFAVRTGQEAFGSFERPGFARGKFDVVLTYRGPAP